MVTTFYPPHVGGIEYHVENLSKQLVKRGHNITVLTSMLPGKKQSPRELSSDGIDVFRIKTIFPTGKLYSSLSSQGITLNVKRTIERLVKEKHIDVIHVHGHHYFLTWRAISAAKRLCIPSVLTLHGLYALNPFDAKAEVAEEIFNRTIFTRELNAVAATIGLTPKITNYAKKYGPPSKQYFSIPNGVNYHIFSMNSKKRFEYRQKYNINKNQIVILFLGRFASIKRVLELAEAAKLVVKKNDRAFFLFVGGGSLTNELAKILLPLKKNYKIVGWTAANEIHELYLASDIFVLPSKSEALPLTILEAMAAKLHIVATPVGGIPEVLQDYPSKTFINKPTSSNICSTLLNVIEQGYGSAIEQPCELTYMKNFDWDIISYKVEKVYQEVISQSETFNKKDNFIQIGVITSYLKSETIARTFKQKILTQKVRDTLLFG